VGKNRSSFTPPVDCLLRSRDIRDQSLQLSVI